ncbi:hypothetical protein cce_2292 [Crocosphaera subtropica ATCC 51142]|uniref:Uncharacterized protein n=1 Tax=Crocosphaera subtropica (strain ATCC 51142 / BH68) TaxID=43989 RepID=B1WQD1_CROS5|nr:hypothetical protein cce_2292 [Crocosphaera subtropica ATCC 51142]
MVFLEMGLPPYSLLTIEIISSGKQRSQGTQGR